MMRLLPAFLLVIAAAATGCVSQSSVESRPVTDNQPVDARRRAEGHTALAGEYFSRGNHTVALAETRAAIKDDPTYFQAYNMQALVYMELREDGPAREAFNNALRIAPTNPEVQNNYGWFLCMRDDPARGLEMLRRAATDNFYQTPEKAWMSMGLCQRKLGRVAEAEESLRRAVLIRPDLVGALYNLAILAYERGAHVDAENYLVRYMRMVPPSREPLVLGVRIARAKNDRVAEDSLMQQLRRLYPDAAELRELERQR
jgi:type IV pilus assembly protein PilF